VLNTPSLTRRELKKVDWSSILVAATLLAVAAIAEAQQPKNMPRIGYLGTVSLSINAARANAFRRGLRDLGYMEGKNIMIEWRSADGKLDRLATIATDLVRLKVDVLVTGGPTATHAAREATSTIPIVMGFDNDPVGSGVVASLSRPSGNVTGLSSLAPEISGKQLEILKEIVPRLARLAVFGNNNEPGNAQNLKEVELAAKAFGIKVQYWNVVTLKDIDTAFDESSKGRIEALLALQNPVVQGQRARFVELASKNRLPAAYFAPEIVEDGGLMTYGASFPDLFRRAATYVDKILKGAKPADLPVEQPKKFEFIINLKTAKQIGLTIPPNVLARADRVIK
jgi:ABC-type uncharacterized transport system substrate-binding protein